MKLITVQATGLVMALFGAAYMAQAQSTNGGQGTRAEMMKKYDADGNGKLDDAERAKMRKEMQAQREKKGEKGEKGKGPGVAEIIKKYDKDGNGELSETELEQFLKDMRSRQRPGGEEVKNERGGERGGRSGNREEMIKKYDTNGDGELSEAERAVLREEMQKRRNRE